MEEGELEVSPANSKNSSRRLRSKVSVGTMRPSQSHAEKKRKSSDDRYYDGFDEPFAKRLSSDCEKASGNENVREENCSREDDQLEKFHQENSRKRRKEEETKTAGHRKNRREDGDKVRSHKHHKKSTRARKSSSSDERKESRKKRKAQKTEEVNKVDVKIPEKEDIIEKSSLEITTKWDDKPVISRESKKLPDYSNYNYTIPCSDEEDEEMEEENEEEEEAQVQERDKEESSHVQTGSDENSAKNKASNRDSSPKSTHGSEETTSLPLYYPSLEGCRYVSDFKLIKDLGEGTYGFVSKYLDLKTGETVALKRLKMTHETEGFPITSLREIKTLMKSPHENIVAIKETIVGKYMTEIYMVMEFVEHDLNKLMASMKNLFTVSQVKSLLIQLLKGVHHLHDNWIIHRDLKPSNLLLTNAGILKIADFGLAREYGSPLKPYTPLVVTRYYRAPELLLGAKLYSTPIDMWSVGCIFAELLNNKVLFPGKSELDQVNLIFTNLGCPSEDVWPGVSEFPAMKCVTFKQSLTNQLRKKIGNVISPKGFELLNGFLTYNPEKRLAADVALKHFFFDETPLPTSSGMFPSWPSCDPAKLNKTKQSPPKNKTRFL